MTMNYSLRDSGTIEQEIEALHNLINGVPPEASSAAFLAPYKDGSCLESIREELDLAKAIEDHQWSDPYHQ